MDTRARVTCNGAEWTSIIAQVGRWFTNCRGENMKEFLNRRITRKQFFMWVILQLLLVTLMKTCEQTGWPLLGAIAALLLFITIPIVFVAAIKRSHDLGRKWPFALLVFIPFACWYFIFAKGQFGPNKYGPDPDPRYRPIQSFSKPVSPEVSPEQSFTKYEDEQARTQDSQKQITMAAGLGRNN